MGDTEIRFEGLFTEGSRITYDSNRWRLQSDRNEYLEFMMPDEVLKISTIGKSYCGEFKDVYLERIELEGNQQIIFRLLINHKVCQQWIIKLFKKHWDCPKLKDVQLGWTHSEFEGATYESL